MKNVDALTIDHDFYVSFIIDADLSQLTNVRLGILQPEGGGEVLRELDSATWSALGDGDTLLLLVDSGDFIDTLKGVYTLQLYGRRLVGQVEELAFSSHEVKLRIDLPAVSDPWRTLP